MDHPGSGFLIESAGRVSGIHRTLRRSLSRLIPLFGVLFFLGVGFAAGPLEPGRYSSRLGKAELIRQGNLFQLNIQTAEGLYRVVGKQQNGGIQCMLVTPAGGQLPCTATAGAGRLDIRVQGQRYRFTRVTRQPGASAGSGSPGTGTGAPHAQGEIGDPSWGFRFTPPKGWSARKTPAGFLLGHDSIKGFVLVSPHEMNSLDEIRAEARKGLVYEQTTRMALAGPLQTLGQNMLGAEFKGIFQGTPARARIDRRAFPLRRRGHGPGRRRGGRLQLDLRRAYGRNRQGCQVFKARRAAHCETTGEPYPGQAADVSVELLFERVLIWRVLDGRRLQHQDRNFSLHEWTIQLSRPGQHVVRHRRRIWRVAQSQQCARDLAGERLSGPACIGAAPSKRRQTGISLELSKPKDLFGRQALFRHTELVMSVVAGPRKPAWKAHLDPPGHSFSLGDPYEIRTQPRLRALQSTPAHALAPRPWHENRV